MTTAVAVLKELRSLGTEQNRRRSARHGVNPRSLYGVSLADLRRLQTQYRGEPQLAPALWLSGMHEARLLACMLADPLTLGARTLQAWAKELGNYILADEFAGLAGKSPQAEKLLARWILSKDEWTARCGWRVLADLALNRKDLPDAYFAGFLPQIEAGIHQARNRARDGMNSALIAIGVRSPSLTRAALAAAGRIGKVDVDHGETDCVTPDAAVYIRKTLEYRQRRQAKVK